ncbi:hypothetical protein OIO90_002975 [Microbotryomycetes sp. JL221]|nr:hypothetical protein OIO90_002975 [Microbotryomycetes sp. JL221]
MALVALSWAGSSSALPAPALVEPASFGRSSSLAKLTKRQGDMSGAIQDLQYLLASAIKGQATGDCAEECGPWVGLIQSCATDASSAADLGTCACEAESVAAMLNCGICFGSEGDVTAENAARLCSFVPIEDPTDTTNPDEPTQTEINDLPTGTGDDDLPTETLMDEVEFPTETLTEDTPIESSVMDDVSSAIESATSEMAIAGPTITSAPRSSASGFTARSSPAGPNTTQNSDRFTAAAPGKHVIRATTLLGVVGIVGMLFL